MKMYNLYKLVTFSAPSKTGKYEPLRWDESADSDDGDVNEKVLFEQTKVKTGKRKCKRLIPTLCWIACIAVAILTVFTVVQYFTRSKTLANYFKKPHIKKPQPNYFKKPQHTTTLEVNKRFKKTPEWTKTIKGFGMFLSPRHVYLKPTSSRGLCFVLRYTSFLTILKGFNLHQNSCQCGKKSTSSFLYLPMPFYS